MPLRRSGSKLLSRPYEKPLNGASVGASKVASCSNMQTMPEVKRWGLWPDVPLALVKRLSERGVALCGATSSTDTNAGRPCVWVSLRVNSGAAWRSLLDDF